MKKFRYRAKKGPEEVVEGVLAAESEDQAIDQINNMGLLPVDLNEEKETAARTVKTAPAALLRKGVASRDITAFYRQLFSLVQSGVPLLKALALVGSQFPNVRLREVVAQIHDRVREGTDLSECLAAFPKFFTPFEIAMVHAGESVGRLDHALSRIVSYREQSEATKSKVKSAVVYPAFLIVMAIGSVAFMLTFVIPKFSSFFGDLGQELPLATRILIQVSQWCVASWYYAVIGMAAVILLIRQGMKSTSNKIVFDRLLLKAPSVGGVLLKTEVSQLCRALEILIGSGLQLLAAMKVAYGVIGNRVLRKSFDECYQVVSEGGRFSEALAQSGVFPALMVQLSQAGEESGKLDEALGQVASWYEQDVEANIKIATSLLEPVIILAVGLILGGIVIAALLPVFSLSAQVS